MLKLFSITGGHTHKGLEHSSHEHYNCSTMTPHIQGP